MKLTKANLVRELAAEQLRMVGFEGDPYAEIQTEDWYRRHRWKTRKQADEFKEKALVWIRKVYPYWRGPSLEMHFSWFSMGYGLSEVGLEN